MCKKELLKTRVSKPRQIEMRGIDETLMSYSQIQYYNDCIRAYASKLDKPIDVAFRKIEKDGLMSIMEQSFHSSKKVSVTVRRMQAAIR